MSRWRNIAAWMAIDLDWKGADRLLKQVLQILPREAAQALDGGWICSQENTYDSNGVALELDSGSAMLCGSNMNNSRFLRNGVAIRVKRLPVEWMTLELYDCSFYGNTVDLDDPQGLVVRR